MSLINQQTGARGGHTIAELQRMKAAEQPSTGGDFETQEAGQRATINEILELAETDIGEAHRLANRVYQSLSLRDQNLLAEEIQRHGRK
jgi:hypothetical protein